MEVKDFIGKVHIAYKGKGVQKAPTEGSLKWDLYLSVANDKLRGWANDPEYGWNSLWDEVDLTYEGGPVEVPENFIRLADEAEMIQGTEKLIFKPTTVELRKVTNGAIYLAGNSPKTIRFTSPIAPQFMDAQFLVPVYKYPPALVNPTDVIVCDNVQWLIFATAAELARNDPAKDDQFQTLIGLANVEYRKMASAAQVIVHNQANQVPRRNTFRIGG